MMIGMIAQIGIRILWETYCYNFGGKTYLQGEGGPIGQRPTMAASRLVMEEFFAEYRKVLEQAEVKIMLMKVYVDDGRQLTTLLRKGMRYDAESKQFRWDMMAEEEDKELEKKGEDKDSFMARLCLPLMNAINKDLTFTAEVAADFTDNRLPTLDFTLWQVKEGELSHSYYEKSMKTQVMLEKESAMGTRQKFTIQSNELTRRLYNVDEELLEKEEEVYEIIEKFTKQAKNSGWSRKDTREMVISGYKGWRKRLERRQEAGGAQYRSAASSLATRARKKLTGREDWFKDGGEKRKREEDEEEPRYWKKTRTNKGEERRTVAKTVAVMFVPCTRGGELAKLLREAEEEQGKQTGYKIKIVERAGTKIVDMLHKNNAWQGEDCRRPGCLMCSTKVRTGRDLNQDCTKRSIVYETWCLTCAEREEKKITEEVDDEEEQKRKIRKIKLHKYVGETARSGYERGLEHGRDLEEMKKESHMLKHFFTHHEGEKLECMEFGMRMVKAHRSAFNRQISESVEIQHQKIDHFILNSKSEYNRCALPRLTAKVGEENSKKMEKEKREEKEEERNLERKIREMKIRKSIERREQPGTNEQPAGKKRKLNKHEYKRVLQEKKEAKKRDREEENNMRGVREQKTYAVFENKRTKNNEIKEETQKEQEQEEETRWEKAWTQEEWDAKIKKREEEIELEEKTRQERMSKQRRLERSWDLLKLCREMMREEGYNWKISRERREEERRKQEESSKAEGKIRREDGSKEKAAKDNRDARETANQQEDITGEGS